MKLTLKNARLAFADLFVPKAFQADDPPKFKATFLIPKNDPQIKVIEAAMLEVATAKWAAKGALVLKGIRGNPNKFCFQDGDNKTYDGFEGMMALGASNKTRPTVIDRDKSPLSEADGRPYSGCYVNAIIDIFAYDNSGNGIAASLSGVQFLRDGEAFSGGRPASADEFEDLGVEDELVG